MNKMSFCLNHKMNNNNKYNNRHNNLLIKKTMKPNNYKLSDNIIKYLYLNITLKL